jgi:outer membrane protein assembly factor BamB
VNDVYALGMSDGKQLWRVQLKGEDTVALVLGGGMLYLGTLQEGDAGPLGSTLMALRASTGALVWPRRAAPPG